jgi:hypothetical protein
MPKFARTLLATLFLAAPIPLRAADTYDTPEAAAADPDFAVQGEYEATGKGIQVIALGGGKFEAVEFKGGLPGAGWDKSEKTRTQGDAAKMKELTSAAKKVERKSPTLGAKPPEGAVVLFDGTADTLKAHWKDGAKMTDDGLLIQGPTSKDAFRSMQLHIEFRLPFMPAARGQGRGNSGYYIDGRYECQMLDSFGLEGLDNECGGIYQIARPDVNMCLPPLVWQTYDIDYTAGEFDDAGKKTKDAHILIKHNGVVIHDRDLPKGTPGGPIGQESAQAGPVYFQDHGNPVRYRHIWVVPAK